MIGKIIRRDRYTFTFIKKVGGLFASLDFAGCDYGYYERSDKGRDRGRMLFRLEVIRNGIISGWRVKRDGTTSNDRITISIATNDVYAVRRKEDQD